MDQEQTERGPDRRWRQKPERLLPNRRDGFDRCALRKGAVPAGPGSIGPAPGEARPLVERRRYPESGME